MSGIIPIKVRNGAFSKNKNLYSFLNENFHSDREFLSWLSRVTAHQITYRSVTVNQHIQGIFFNDEQIGVCFEAEGNIYLSMWVSGKEPLNTKIPAVHYRSERLNLLKSLFDLQTYDEIIGELPEIDSKEIRFPGRRQDLLVQRILTRFRNLGDREPFAIAVAIAHCLNRDMQATCVNGVDYFNIDDGVYISVCGENITTYVRGMEIDGRPTVAAIRSMFEPYSPITISDMTLNLLHSNLERMDRYEQLLSIYMFFSARYPKLKFNKDHNAFWFNSVVICLATGVAFCEIASKRIEWDSRLPIPKNVITAANNAILMYVELHERLFSNGETVHQNPLFEQHWLGEDVLKEISPNCLNSGLMYNRFGLEINWLPQHIRIFDEAHPNTKVPLAPLTYITSMIRLYIEAHPANIQKFPQTLLPMQWSHHV